MTVVNPKSISGINSITTGSGSDDILTIHNNNGTERLRVDSTGATKIVTGIVTTLTTTTGIVTTLTTNTLTANSTAKVGSGVTLSPDGDVFATGVCTATSFSGDGSNLTGISAGVSLSGSTDNTVATVTGANAITGEANLKFDGSGTLTIVDTELAESTDNFSINIQSGNNDFYVKSGGTTFAAFKGSAKDLQLTSGNLVIATSGKGIDFSATTDVGGMSSELLDDYEEGTFTPTVTFGTGSAGQGYNYQLGRYIKVGHLVHTQIYIYFNDKGSSTGTAEITGLPYTSYNQTAMYPSANFGYWNKGSSSAGPGSISHFIGYMNPNSTKVNIQRQEMAQSTPAVNDATEANFANDTDFMLNLTYYAA